MTASSSLGSEQADARGRTHRVHQEQCNLSTVQLFLEGSPSLYVQLSLYAHMECCTHSWFVFFARIGLCVVQRSSGHTVKCLSRVKKSQRKVVRECVQCLYDFFFPCRPTCVVFCFNHVCVPSVHRILFHQFVLVMKSMRKKRLVMISGFCRKWKCCFSADFLAHVLKCKCFASFFPWISCSFFLLWGRTSDFSCMKDVPALYCADYVFLMPNIFIRTEKGIEHFFI